MDIARTGAGRDGRSSLTRHEHAERRAADLAEQARHAIGQTGCFVAGTAVWVEVPQFAVVGDDSEFDDANSARTMPIEEVRLGQRVPSHRSETFDRDDPDYADWKEIRLVVSHRNGSVVDVQLLRSEEWIDANGIRVGETIDLRMTELEVNADALVVSITDGPEVLPGEEPVVTGRFVTRLASELVRVTFAGEVELVGTKNHPIWSPLHQDWRALGEFEPGDLVQARTGLNAVQAVEPLAIRPAVYNIDVADEHVYEVTELGVLVHNNELCDERMHLRLQGQYGEKGSAIAFLDKRAKNPGNSAKSSHCMEKCSRGGVCPSVSAREFWQATTFVGLAFEKCSRGGASSFS